MKRKKMLELIYKSKSVVGQHKVVCILQLFKTVLSRSVFGLFLLYRNLCVGDKNAICHQILSVRL